MSKFNYNNFKKDLIAYIIFVVVVLINVFVPDSVFRTTCPIRLTLGVPCPGCGITRAFIEVFKGNILEANKYHPFWLPIIFLFVAFVIIRYFTKEDKQKKLYKALEIAVIVVGLLMIAFYIYRMITVFPDAEPMVMDDRGLIPWIRDSFQKVN